MEQSFLDLFVQRCVCVEAWRVVDLQELQENELSVIPSFRLGRTHIHYATMQYMLHDYPHLYEPGLKLFVYEDIESEYFEAGTASVVVGEAGSVVVLQDWVCCYQRFYDHILRRDGEGEMLLEAI